MKIMKKILCTVLVVVLCLTSAPLSGFDFTAEATDYKVGDIIQFGSYPQSEVKDEDLITELNELAPEWDDWTSYGYYSSKEYKMGTMVKGDWMRYTDVIYNSNKYRGVKFTKYRPTQTCAPSSDTCQYGNGYRTNTVYWFKFELINWRVLNPVTGLVMCETIIDTQPYSNTIYNYSGEFFSDASYTNYASDYETSSIRQWLNTDFYDTAFSSSEKKTIKLTTLNNDGYYTSKGTTGYERYDSNSTIDKIFLLSYNEVRNSNYGFNSSSSAYDPARFAQGSDYAQSQGLDVYRSSGSTYNNNSYWLLRSPGLDSGGCCCVNYCGTSHITGNVIGSSLGVRPALCLSSISDIVNPNDDKNSYINQHIDFVNGDTYEVIEYLRFANTLWDNMDNWLQNGAELAHDIIEGPLEIVSFQFLDGLECAANPYDTILLDFLASDVSRSYFVETAQEDALVIAMRIINDIIKMFDFDYKWAEKFDLKEELKNLIFASDYSGNQLYQALNTLFMGQSKKEIKVAFESFECFDKLFNYLEAGSSVLDFFVEMLRYVVAVEAFNNSSKYFRETLELISLSMYKVNTNYADKFEDTLSFYKESLTYDNIVDFVIENKGADGLVNLFYKMSTDLLSKATYSLIMSAFKVSSTVAGKINAALWSAEVGFGLSNLITGNDTKVNCRRLLRANYMFEIAAYEVMETYKAGLLKKETTEAALYFDAGFNVFKATQIYSMDQYKKYCECTASKPLTIKKNYFKNEKEDIAGKIIAWQNIKCHSDDTKAVKIDTVVVECPTDIYVYRKSDNKLVASVIDNISKSYSDEVSIVCIGEEKALGCASLDDYRIEIMATDNGKMDVTYNSYSDFKNTKKLSFDDVPIKSGNKYELDDEKESIKRDDNVEYKTDGRVDNCSCNCHAGGIKGFFFKFLLFFQKIFRTNKVCKCGINHY